MALDERSAAADTLPFNVYHTIVIAVDVDAKRETEEGGWGFFVCYFVSELQRIVIIHKMVKTEMWHKSQRNSIKMEKMKT